jgi:hypothetical protein
VLSATLVVDRTVSMRPRTFDLLSPRSRSQTVARVPRLHRQTGRQAPPVQHHDVDTPTFSSIGEKERDPCTPFVSSQLSPS